MVVHQVHNKLFKWMYFLNGQLVVHIALSGPSSLVSKIIGPTQAILNELLC